MSSIDNGPGQKQDKNEVKTSGKDEKTTSKDRSRYYKEGEESPTGPNWDKLSKGAEGDSGQNAGVFK